MSNEKIRQLQEQHPEFFDKYGDPTDESDPRNWEPSSRGERGLSLNDRVKLLELDMDLIKSTVQKVMPWVIRKQEEEMLEEFKRDPQKFLANFAKQMGTEVPPEVMEAAKQLQPVATDNRGAILPDAMLPTVNGPVRADSVPGYRFEPDWAPSEEWSDENCACPVHQEMREKGQASKTTSNNADLPGLYL
jgi:hypothetical protein